MTGSFFDDWYRFILDSFKVLEGKEAHKCLKCGKSFGILGSLNNHVRRVHGNEVKEQQSTIFARMWLTNTKY